MQRAIAAVLAGWMVGGSVGTPLPGAWAQQPKGGTAPAPVKGGFSRLKVQFITQAGIRPPLFILFTSGGKGGLHFSYLRYIENRLREEFDFFATPIRLVERHKVKKGK